MVCERVPRTAIRMGGARSLSPSKTGNFFGYRSNHPQGSAYQQLEATVHSLQNAFLYGLICRES